MSATSLPLASIKPSPASPCDSRRVLLVETAVERYLDENKSSCDPIMAQQMRTWALEWVMPTNEDEEDKEKEEMDEQKRASATTNEVSNSRNRSSSSSSSSSSGPPPSSPSQRTSVHLVRWRGEYATVTLRADCRSKAFSSVTGNHEELHVLLQASAVLRSDDDDNTGKRPAASSTTVRRKMVKRLAQDDYVSKLLLGNGSSAATTQDLPVLCEANIVATTAATNSKKAGGEPPNNNRQHEERYSTDEDVAEAIRRAVWPASNDVMDVWEFVLQYLPILPLEEGGAASTLLTPLASRAQLRLLEDAMCDACERHGDEQLVDELRLHDEPVEPEGEGDRGVRGEGGGAGEDNGNDDDDDDPSGSSGRHREQRQRPRQKRRDRRVRPRR